MGVVQRRAAAGAIALLLLGVLPARGHGSDASWAGAAAGAAETAEAVRAATASFQLAPAVRAAAGLAGLTIQPGPAALAGPAPAGLPAPVAQAVARLSGAIAAADPVVRGAVRDPGADPAALLLELAARRDAALARGDTATVAAVAKEAGAAAARIVDQASMARAAAEVAAAVDQAVPVLRAHARTLTAGATGSAVGCDVVDQPVLCIGGAGANTYTRDVALLIDLGGDDLHTGSAGAADATKNLPVAVTVDVGGNDRYAAVVPTASGFAAVQGAGRLGVGMLLDVAGDDSYESESSAALIDANGQGYGGAGVGVLADLAGNDRYRMTKKAGTGTNRAGHAQGYGAAGIGILLDAAGDDVHEVLGHFTPTINEEGLVGTLSPFVQGLGFGALGGVALVADGGGTDQFLLQAGYAPIPADDAWRLAGRAGAAVEGLGYGDFGGTAMVLTGNGDTTWTGRAVAAAPSTGVADVDAFGVGKTGAVGVLSDGGGNDRYLAEAVTTADAARVVDAGCGDCTDMELAAQAGRALVAGFGYGSGGTGVLIDRAGDDRHEAVARTTARAAAVDGRDGVAPFATAWTDLVNMTVHGVGVAGAGAMFDLAGSDVYAVTTEAAATASSDAPNGEGRVDAISGRTLVLSQAGGSGGGYGELRDTGGADRYQVALSSRAEPAAFGSPGALLSSVQGAVDDFGISGVSVPAFATFADLDGGAADVFTVNPADPACTGTRGTGAWRDCGTGAGIGLNA